MTEMVPTLINGRWELLLPDHRAARPEWPWWEAQRLAVEYHVIANCIKEQFSGSPGSPLLPNPIVFCVGAEEGDFPALYALWGADVVLFEPNARVWPNIKAIFEANRLRPPLECFVGFAADTSAGWETPLVWLDEHWPECAAGDVTGDHGFCNLWERPDIPRVKIDHIVARPDMITIDVEGAELQVLKGATETLTRDKPVVLVSIHEDFMRDGYGNHPSDVHDLMTDHGYESRFICVDHEAHWFFQHPDNRRMQLT